jgi:hypothetical protein
MFIQDLFLVLMIPYLFTIVFLQARYKFPHVPAIGL